MSHINIGRRSSTKPISKQVLIYNRGEDVCVKVLTIQDGDRHNIVYKIDGTPERQTNNAPYRKFQKIVQFFCIFLEAPLRQR